MNFNRTLRHLLVLSLIPFFILSCSSNVEVTPEESGVVIEISSNDLYLVYPHEELPNDFNAEVTLEDAQGNRVKSNQVVSFQLHNEKYLSEPIDLGPGNYRLVRFAPENTLKNDQWPALCDFAYSYRFNDNDCVCFDIENDYITRLLLMLRSMCYEEETEAPDFNINLLRVPGFYVFVNRCNPGDRENYHEVLSYEVRAFTADTKGNPVEEIFAGDNFMEKDKPGPCLIYCMELNENGLILQLTPTGEKQVYNIHVTKEEIDKYLNGFIDFVHLEVGCNE